MKFLEFKLANSKIMLTQFAPQSSDPALHSHGEDYQISIPLVGTPYIEFNQQPYRLDVERRLITAPGEFHRHFANDEAGKVLLINVNQSFLQKVLLDRLGHLPTSLEFAPWENGSSEAFERLAQNMMKLGLSSSLEQAELEELEWELAHLLFTQHRGSHSAYWREQVAILQHPLIKRAIDYIHEQFTEELTLDQMAAASGLSKFHFIRLFREYVGMTPSHYLNQVRIEKAEQLLKQSTFDVTMIAYEVGFGSLNTFERLFKKKQGMSASEYRKRNRD